MSIDIEKVLHGGGLALPNGVDVSAYGPTDCLPGRHRLTEAATAGIALAGAAAAHVHYMRTGTRQSVRVDSSRAAAALRSYQLIRVDGILPPVELTSTFGLFQCKDGRWICLSGATPRLHRGLLRLLGVEDDAQAVVAAVRTWNAVELEDAIGASGCAGAAALSTAEWRAHPQSAAVESLGTVNLVRIGDAAPQKMRPGRRPLEGLRVLDSTRLLAGPVCGRTLAEHGADVLNVRSHDLPDIGNAIHDTNEGKRSCHLDLRDAAGLERFKRLAAEADVIVESSRGTMASLGLGPEDIARLRPGLIYVSMNCYGHEGPWHDRRGTDPLVQMSMGMALDEQDELARPQLFPVAPNDYLTGYLSAAAVMMVLARQADEGGSWHVRTSLAQTAHWIQSLGLRGKSDMHAASDPMQHVAARSTPWGTLTTLPPVVEMSETPAVWDRVSAPAGYDPPSWDVRIFEGSIR